MLVRKKLKLLSFKLKFRCYCSLSCTNPFSNLQFIDDNTLLGYISIHHGCECVPPLIRTFIELHLNCVVIIILALVFPSGREKIPSSAMVVLREKNPVRELHSLSPEEVMKSGRIVELSPENTAVHFRQSLAHNSGILAAKSEAEFYFLGLSLTNISTRRQTCGSRAMTEASTTFTSQTCLSSRLITRN